MTRARPALCWLLFVLAAPLPALAASPFATPDDRWLRENLPDALMRMGPHGLARWQWIALPALVVAAWILGVLFAWVVRRVLEPVFARTKATWDDELLLRMRGPMTLVGAITALRVLYPSLDLPSSAELLVHKVLKAGLLVTVFWTALRTIDIGAQATVRSPWSKLHPAAIGLMPLGVRVAKIACVLMAAIAVLSELGYPVASLIAGLGIGGLAVALAAQKTLENLFGSVTISVDQPFRVGDFVKVDDLVGTIEYVGLRSTRLRTLDRTVVTLPNGKLADSRTETYSVRDRIRLSFTLGLAYGATAGEVREVLHGVERLLRAHPKIWPDDLSVRLTKLGDWSMTVEATAWFATTDWNEYSLIRQDVLLQVLEVVERSGAKLAYPTQTVELAGAGRGGRP